jgi:hypothetical protein
MATLTSSSNRTSALYILFAWHLMMVRSTIATILGEAERSRVTDPEVEADPGERLPGSKTEVHILAGLGRSVRSDFNAVIRHNCAGAVFQIAYSLFENLVKSLGFEPGPDVRCGPQISGEPLSRILWAGRNAFAHGDEWKRHGPKHRRAQDSYTILTAIGFENPANVNLYDIYTLMSGASTEAFVQAILAAGKDLSEQPPPLSTPAPAGPSESTNALLQIALGLLLIGIVHLYREVNYSDDGIQSIMAFQYGSGKDARTIPVAEGKVKNLVKIAEALRSGAIDRLSPDAARPYREVEARLKAWYANFEVLIAMNVEDKGYAEDLSELCSRAQDLNTLMSALPDPFDLLQKERGVASMEDGQRLMAEIMTDEGFTPLPFREVAVDIVNFKSAEVAGS